MNEIYIKVDARDPGILYTLKRKIRSYCRVNNVGFTASVKRDGLTVRGVTLSAVERLARETFITRFGVHKYRIY